MNRKMKTILVTVIVLCFVTLCLVSFLYIRGTIRRINQAKEAENSVNIAAQTDVVPQETTSTAASTEAKSQIVEDIQTGQAAQPEQETQTGQEIQAEQNTPKKKEYRLCGDTVWTIGTANLYEQDDESSNVLYLIPGGTKLERIGASDQWALVKGEGIQGFVLQTDLTIVEP